MKYPFGTLTITKKSKKLIKKALKTNKLSCGKYVRELEKKFAEIIGIKEAVAVSSGTDALTIALSVLYYEGAERNNEIILPALSYISTGSSVIQAGFKPVFVDIKKDTLNIDVDKIVEAINPYTIAILPVHLIGKPAKMDIIKQIATQNTLYVIGDGAEAYGTVYKGKDIALLARMTCYSLYAAHIITSIEGGIIVTDNSDWAMILRSLRNHGRACACKQCVVSKGENCYKRYANGRDKRFQFDRLGYSSKMNELEAAVGLGNLEIYDKILATRRRNLLYLREQFKQFQEHFYTIEEDENEIIGPHAFPIILRENQLFNRDEYVRYLEGNGIDSRSLFSSMPTQCKGFEFLGYKLGDFPNAEYIGNNGLHIGVHQDITKAKIDYFIKTTKKFIGEI